MRLPSLTVASVTDSASFTMHHPLPEGTTINILLNDCEAASRPINWPVTDALTNSGFQNKSKQKLQMNNQPKMVNLLCV
jgi:hypothetical protein